LERRAGSTARVSITLLSAMLLTDSRPVVENPDPGPGN
jgi:hypothetical protein